MKHVRDLYISLMKYLMIDSKKVVKFQVFTLSLIFSYIFMIPMSSMILADGHDIFYHLSRIMGSYELFNLGVFPAKVLPGFYFDYGYAVGLFYPTGLLYIPVVFMYLGLGIIPSYLIFIFVINIVTYISMYFASYSIAKSRWIAHLSAFLYLFSTYRAFSDFYTRQALGEFIALMFLPMIFYGIYKIIYEETKYWPVLTIGMSGLITSHTLSTLLSAIFLAVLSIINLKKFIKEPKRIIALGVAALVTIALTNSYLLSMWQMMQSDLFQYHEPWTYAAWNTLKDVKYMFYGFWTVSKFPYGLDYISLMILVFGLVLLRKTWNKIPMYGYMIVSIFVSIFLTTSLVPTTLLQFMNFMQFPWRLFVFVTFFSSIVVASFIGFTNQKYIKFILTIALIFYTFLSYFGFASHYIKTHTGYSDFPGYSPYHASAEFIPLDADMPKLIVRSFNQQVISNNELDYTYKRDAASYTIYFSGNSKDDTVLEIPLLFYRGYAAYITSPQGNEFLEISESDQALINVQLKDFNEGVIRVFYNGTSLQKYSSYLSILSVSIFIIYLFLFKRKREQANK